MIKVFGYSDDTVYVEVEGANARKAFTPPSDDRLWLEFSDGSIISVEYNHEGCWEVRAQVEGAAYVRHEPYTDPEGCYTDTVYLRPPLELVKVHENTP